MGEHAETVRIYADDLSLNRGIPSGDLHAAADRLEQLEAIVERLPKTADGVLVVPGMKVYIPGYTGAGEVDGMHVGYVLVNEDRYWPDVPHRTLRDSAGGRLTTQHKPSLLYSSPKAAQAAREQERGGDEAH